MTIGLVDCSYHEAHADFHHPHPNPPEGQVFEGRLVCAICHPVPPPRLTAVPDDENAPE